MNAQNPTNADAWRVAALTMMKPGELATLLESDQQKAAMWVGSASRLGIVEAQLRMGRMLLAGEGVARDEAAAFSWFVHAAAGGNAEACNMVGRCFENGWGTEPDFVRAVHWYRRAADAGDSWAQYNLGHLYLDGNGVTRDRAEALRWYKCSARKGHPRAMNLVGRCCEEGWGGARDPIAARHWYRQSAQGGYFRGAFNYATILAAENCRAGAMYWIRKAVSLAPEEKRAALTHAWQRGRTNPTDTRHSQLQTPAAHA